MQNLIKKSAFSDREIKLMEDVTKSHQALAKCFGKPITSIQEYRRNNLGIYLRGLNFKIENIRDTVDWQLSAVSIARNMKVSPRTVIQWKRQLFGKPDKRRKLKDDQQLDIARSSEKSTTLAIKYGVTVGLINYVRRKTNTNVDVGRPKLTFLDFPDDTDWRAPTSQIARKLKISWRTADRLRTEALLKSSYRPTVQVQLSLPIVNEAQKPLVESDEVDWNESTSLISAYLKLDKSDVSRLKSTARHRRRKTKAV